MDRVCIFIDGSNLEISIKNSFNKRVAPEKLSNKLAAGRRLIRVLYYEAPLIQNVNPTSFNGQQQFFQRLRMHPLFEIRLGRRVQRNKQTKCPKCGEAHDNPTWVQKGVDSLLTFDLVSLAFRNAYDTAIVIAGDEDFVTPCIEVRCLGKMVENAFTKYGWAPRLKLVADNTLELTEDYLSDCWG
ncbi:hypothetical protein ES703_58757 [subsurface metagenome]